MSTSHLGGRLQRARETRGLTVEAVASLTKIAPRHIQAFERGVALNLPPFYQRAEIRALARAIGVDEHEALANLDALLAPADPPADPPAAAPPERGGRVRSEFVLATLGAAILIALFGWQSYSRTAASGSSAGAPQDTSAPRPIQPPVTLARAAPFPDAATKTTAVEEAPVEERPVAETPVAPTGPTRLDIRTQPEGARVTVDGIGWGVAPVTIEHLEPGEKRIRVSMDGFTSSERSIVIVQGGRATVRIRLAEARSVAGR